MPPGSSQKGPGKKAGASAMAARQRSRNTTPSSVLGASGAASGTASLPPVETVGTEYLELKFELFRNITYDDIVDPGTSGTVVPDSRSLDGIVDRLQHLHDIIEHRGHYCDRGMRLLAATRRTRMDELAAERGREEERLRKEVDDEEREKRSNKKKRKAPDSLAPQDSNLERSSPHRESSGKPQKHSRDNDSASSSLSPVAPATPGAMDVDEKVKEETKKKEDEEEEDSSTSEEDDGRPQRPAPPAYQTFGEDPSTFPDPTIYEIRPVYPGMSDEEKREIYSVAKFPRSDLSDIIAGDPPDKDFSNAKPSNQISFSTFSTYIEPYFRPFTEEDLAFLRERGDRVTPFVMPKRGKKHYSDIWAEEDGAMAVDSSPPSRDRLAPNQPRGGIDNMDDDVAETDKLSVGPLLSRLLSALRPESRAPSGSSDDKPTVNGDTSLNGDVSMSMDSGAPNGDSIEAPPATQMPESSSEAWKKATHPKLEYHQVDERIKQELRHIGFLPQPDPGSGAQPPAGGATTGAGGAGTAASTAEYDCHYDDEVAARLRLLQDRLREQMLINGARKSRLDELVRGRMAFQEYQTILEDLDSQVQAAYLKRTRTMGKSKKAKRPGGAGGGAAAAAAAGASAGTARPGIGDLTKTLMERRRRWVESIGPVFNGDNMVKVPRQTDPDSSIFKPDQMAEYLRKEKEAWDEEVEED